MLTKGNSKIVFEKISDIEKMGLILRLPIPRDIRIQSLRLRSISAFEIQFKKY